MVHERCQTEKVKKRSGEKLHQIRNVKKRSDTEIKGQKKVGGVNEVSEKGQKKVNKRSVCPKHIRQMHTLTSNIKQSLAYFKMLGLVGGHCFCQCLLYSPSQIKCRKTGFG